MGIIWDSKDQEVFLVITEELELDEKKQKQLMSLMKTAKLEINEQYHPLCSTNKTKSGVSNYDISNARYQVAMGCDCVRMKREKKKTEKRMSHPSGYIAALREEGYPSRS